MSLRELAVSEIDSFLNIYYTSYWGSGTVVGPGEGHTLNKPLFAALLKLMSKRVNDKVK